MTDAAKRPRVLFLCTGNACRSQMAEGWLRHLTAGRIEVLSAGTAPAGVHPRAVAAMEEVGIDLGQHTSDPLERFLAQPLDLVITVCSSAARDCPTLPGATRVLSWSFDDPAGFEGEEADVQREFRRVRDEIRGRIESWLADGLPPLG